MQRRTKTLSIPAAAAAAAKATGSYSTQKAQSGAGKWGPPSPEHHKLSEQTPGAIVFSELNRLGWVGTTTLKKEKLTKFCFVAVGFALPCFKSDSGQAQRQSAGHSSYLHIIQTREQIVKN